METKKSETTSLLSEESRKLEKTASRKAIIKGGKLKTKNLNGKQAD